MDQESSRSRRLRNHQDQPLKSLVQVTRSPSTHLMQMMSTSWLDPFEAARTCLVVDLRMTMVMIINDKKDRKNKKDMKKGRKTSRGRSRRRRRRDPSSSPSSSSSPTTSSSDSESSFARKVKRALERSRTTENRAKESDRILVPKFPQPENYRKL